MTKTHSTTRPEALARAIWFRYAPRPEERSGAVREHDRGQNLQAAAATAAAAHAALVAEFTCSGPRGGHPSDDAWAELLDFLTHQRANVLVVLRAQDIAHAAADLTTRIDQLEDAGVRLTFPYDAKTSTTAPMRRAA